MIFVTIGTHPGQFDRLIRHIDAIAPKVKEKIIIQTGFTKYKPKNVEYFDFAPNLKPYFKDARIVISHSATSLLEFVLEHKKPIITVPRQKRYDEHMNDHQVEFAEALTKQTGIRMILDIKEITPELLSLYSSLPKIKKDNLHKLQSFFKREFDRIAEEIS